MRQENLQHLRAALFLHRSRNENENSNAAMPCIMSNCRLSEEAKKVLQDMFLTLGTGQQALLLSSAKSSIQAHTNLPVNHLQDLSMYELPSFERHKPQAAAQPWAKTINCKT
eukprot:6139358-Amphidinium_carterae.1